MQKYICKCGKTFEKSSKAETTGYAINNYSPQHECYGCPFIVTEQDWNTKEVIKRECRATPKITYLTRCRIGTEKGDFSACKLYSLGLVFVKRVMSYVKFLDGAEITEFGNKIPDKWRASDFGQCYSFDNCYGLAVFDLSFKANKTGTQARRLVKERFFYEDGSRRDMTEESERETVLMRIQIAKENAGNKTVAIEQATEKTEEKTMGGFNINAFISQQEQLKQININLLVPYHNHKFRMYSGERLDDMVQSIKANGVLTPIIVHPAPGSEGKYEILAGHNRCNAAKKAGLTAVPGIIKENLSDEEAEMYVIESNTMQRGFGDLAISEQAAVIAMRHKTMFSSDKRAEILKELNEFENSGGNETEKKRKLALAGEEYGLGKNSVARLVRVNALLESCGKYTASVDSKTLSVRAAVELSYIHRSALNVIFEKYQTSIVIENVWNDVVNISMNTAVWLRSLFESFRGSEEQAEMLLERSSDKSRQRDEGAEAKPIKISIPRDTFKKYFTEETKADEAAEIIDKALEMYFKLEKEKEDLQ